MLIVTAIMAYTRCMLQLQHKHSVSLVKNFSTEAYKTSVPSSVKKPFTNRTGVSATRSGSKVGASQYDDRDRVRSGENPANKRKAKPFAKRPARDEPEENSGVGARSYSLRGGTRARFYEPGELPYAPLRPIYTEFEKEEQKIDIEEISASASRQNVLFEEMFRSHPSSLDLSDCVVSARTIHNKTACYYDINYKETIHTPKPLHPVNDISKEENIHDISATSLPLTASSLHHFANMLKHEKETQVQPEVNADIVGSIETEYVPIRLTKSQLELAKNQLVPSFEGSKVHSDVVGKQGNSGSVDMHSVSLGMLRQAYEKKLPIRGRIMNEMQGGVAVAVGTWVCFMPNIHFIDFSKVDVKMIYHVLKSGSPMPPFAELRSLYENKDRFDVVNEIKHLISGHEVWVMVLEMERKSSRFSVAKVPDIVVSHMNVPEQFLHPAFYRAVYRDRGNDFRTKRWGLPNSPKE